MTAGHIARAALILVAGLLLAACAQRPFPAAPDAGEPVALELDTATQVVSVTDPTPTPSVIWDRALQDSIKRKGPGPTVTARLAAILHGALFDIWAAYHPSAVGHATAAALRRAPDQRTPELRAEAMHFGAHMLLSGMFPEDAERFDRILWALGHDPETPSLSATPAGVGRVIAANVMADRRTDGSNWDDGFADETGYAPANPAPTAVRLVDRWTPENTPIDPEDGTPDQDFLTPQWARLAPMLIGSPDAFRPPPPEPFLVPPLEGTVNVAEGRLRLSDGRSVAVGPELVGPVINPAFVAQAEAVVAASAALTDRHKMIAEFWEDNKDTSFPPGTWLTFGQYVSARDDHGMDEDAPMFFALAAAQLDASIATWEAKVRHDYTRPVRAIRTLGRLGLIGTPGTDAETGETGNVVRAWAGPGKGTRTILARRFLSYQNPDSDPSPPFAEYPSGHSGFSAAAAEVLRSFTGSDRFGGEIVFPAGSSRFEPGLTPAAPVRLRWETFSEAADEAGISRIYGGIHFRDGDLEGRRIGRAVGRAVVERVRALVAGSG